VIATTTATTNLPNPSGGLADNQDMKNFASIFLDAFDKKRNMLGTAYADNASFSMTVQVGQWTDTSQQMDKLSKDEFQTMVSRSRNLTKINPHRMNNITVTNSIRRQGLSIA
jgi:hypothetical protein